MKKCYNFPLGPQDDPGGPRASKRIGVWGAEPRWRGLPKITFFPKSFFITVWDGLGSTIGLSGKKCRIMGSNRDFADFSKIYDFRAVSCPLNLENTRMIPGGFWPEIQKIVQNPLKKPGCFQTCYKNKGKSQKTSPKHGEK